MVTDARWRFWIGQVAAFVERRVFAPTCGGCGWPGSWWCSACARSVQALRVQGPRCLRCDLPLGAEIARCRDCAEWPVELRAVRSLYVYEGPIKTALHRVKYRGERRRGEALARELADRASVLLGDWCNELACVVPVPLHSDRLRARGFNQSAVLAAAVARALDLPLGDDLERHRPTGAQVGRSREERWRNVAGAFRWRGHVLRGTVLLVDDVVTTGATIASATTALVRGGAENVVVLALARARFD